MALLKEVGPAKTGFLFPSGASSYTEKAITTAAMMKCLAQIRPNVTCHGFRSSFRDWAAENTTEGDVAEAALAHKLKNQTVAAYLRTKFFEKRIPLMSLWADHCHTI